jgi:hypothetical protein
MGGGVAVGPGGMMVMTTGAGRLVSSATMPLAIAIITTAKMMFL